MFTGNFVKMNPSKESEMFLAHLSMKWSSYVRCQYLSIFSVNSDSIGILMKLHRKHPIDVLSNIPSKSFDPCRILVQIATGEKKKDFRLKPVGGLSNNWVEMFLVWPDLTIYQIPSSGGGAVLLYNAIMKNKKLLHFKPFW